MKNKKTLAVFELKYYYIDEDGNTDGKHYEYKGDHSSFCDGIDEDQLEEIRYKWFIGLKFGYINLI